MTMFATVPTTEFRQGHGYVPDREAWNPSNLEAVRDMLRREDHDRNPSDLYAEVDMTHIDWSGDLLTFQKIEKDDDGKGVFGEPIGMTRHALNQLARDVLPARGLQTLYSLHGAGPRGRQLATMVWSHLATRVHDVPRIAKVLDDVTGSVGTDLVVRGVVSTSYAPFRDLHLVESMLKEMGNRPVIEWKRWHQGFRVLVRADDDYTQPELREPVKVLRAWNGETGGTGVDIEGATWTWWCLNGMANYVPERSRKFRHVGSLEGLATKVAGVLEAEVIRADGILEQYSAARDTQVDDLFQLMRDELMRPGVLQLSEEKVERSIKLLMHDSIPSPDMTLSRALDAVTYAAQEEEDPFTQRHMEYAAGRMVARGLSQATKGRIRNG